MKYLVNIDHPELNDYISGKVILCNNYIQLYSESELIKEFIIDWQLQIKIESELEIKINNFTLIFDQNSASAYQDFKNQLQKMLKSISYQETYPTGELKLIGTLVDGKLTGEGIWYYQNGKIKYQGEFENGVPDGKGKFYSATNPLTLIVPNIANGKFVGIMTLIIGEGESSRKIRIKAADHPELYLHWQDNDLVDQLGNKVISNFQQEMFKQSNLQDQLSDLFHKITLLEHHNNLILEYINTPWYYRVWNSIKSKFW